MSTPARRSSRHTSKPSFRGSMTSSRISSNFASARARSAAIAVGDHFDLVAFAGQVLLQPQRDAGLVFDDENPCLMCDLLPRGQNHGEPASPARLAVHLHSPAVCANDVMHHRQPDARAFHVEPCLLPSCRGRTCERWSRRLRFGDARSRSATATAISPGSPRFSTVTVTVERAAEYLTALSRRFHKANERASRSAWTSPQPGRPSTVDIVRTIAALPREVAPPRRLPSPAGSSGIPGGKGAGRTPSARSPGEPLRAGAGGSRAPGRRTLWAALRAARRRLRAAR